MSSPSGKPFDPFDLSPYAPKRARERTGLDDKDPNVVLPYAPRTGLPPLDSSGPERPHDLDSTTEDPSAPAVSAANETAAEHETGLTGVLAAAAKEAAEAMPAATPADEVVADPDLRRLEASLQWIQREGTASRLPRATTLPPVSGLRPVGPEGLRPRGEQFINGIRVPPSLAPERLRPPPMRERRDNLRGPVRVLLASLIAAPIAYYFSVGSFSSSKEPNRDGSGLTSLASRLVASAEFPLPKDKLPPGEADDYNTMVSSQNKLVAPPPPATVAKAAPVHTEPQPPVAVMAAPPAAPATEQPAAAPAAAPAPAVKAVREMDPQQVKLLMQQGEQFLAAGDVITARTVFQRAAEGGNAAAALALGATYDPEVLAKMGARGVNPDVQKARMWYERAKEYGSSDAPRRLEALVNR
jgi:hypothetical protein